MKKKTDATAKNAKTKNAKTSQLRGSNNPNFIKKDDLRKQIDELEDKYGAALLSEVFAETKAEEALQRARRAENSLALSEAERERLEALNTVLRNQVHLLSNEVYRAGRHLIVAGQSILESEQRNMRRILDLAMDAEMRHLVQEDSFVHLERYIISLIWEDESLEPLEKQALILSVKLAFEHLGDEDVDETIILPENIKLRIFDAIGEDMVFALIGEGFGTGFKVTVSSIATEEDFK